MTGEQSETQTQRVCAWCSDRTGENYVEIQVHRPASFDGRYFCSHECASRWFDAE